MSDVPNAGWEVHLLPCNLEEFEAPFYWVQAAEQIMLFRKRVSTQICLDGRRIHGSPVGSEGIRFLMGPRFLPLHGVFHAYPRPYSVYLRQDCQRSQLHGVPAPFALWHQRCETLGHSFRPFSRGLHCAQEVRQPVLEDPKQLFQQLDGPEIYAIGGLISHFPRSGLQRLRVESSRCHWRAPDVLPVCVCAHARADSSTHVLS